MVSSTDQTNNKKPLSKAYNIRYLETIPVSELYLKNLDLYQILFEESKYLKDKIEERLEVLLKAKYLRKNRNTEPFLQKEKYHQIKPNSDKQIPTQIFASFANRSREKMGISSFLHLLSPNPN